MFKENRLIYKTNSEVPDAEEVSDFWRNVPVDYDSCGIGFVATRDASRRSIDMALQGLCAMKDRTGEAFQAGDGAGVIFETGSSRELLKSWLPPEQRIDEDEAVSAGMFFFEPELGGDPKSQKNQIEIIQI